jgi:hypothetical protein
MTKKNAVLITVIIGLFFLISSILILNSVSKKDHEKQLSVIETQKQFYSGVINSRDSLINEALKTFDTIEQELSAIKQKENIITVNSSNREFSQNKKDKILGDITYIGTLLENNKKKIIMLNNQLKSYGIELKGLKNKIIQLETDINQNQMEIANLKTLMSQKEIEISSLNNKVDEQQSTIMKENEIISNQTIELNKVFIVSGTKKELLDKGVISKSGGFLGIGKKQQINFNNNLFIQTDLTQLNSIPVNSKNVKLITDHPIDSYKFKYNDNVISSIEIINPSEFWKASKYLIIEIK